MAQFDRFAGDYQSVLDESVGSAAYFARVKALAATDVLGVGFAGRVLDYGCGVGLLARALLDHLPRATLVGFDVSQPCLDGIAEPLRSRAAWTSDKTAVGGEFAAVVVSNVLHHVPPAQRDGLVADLAGRLAPGGRLLVFEHNPLNPATRWVVAHCAFDDDAVLLWPRETTALLQTAGLQGVRIEYLACVPPALGRLLPLERHVRHLPLGAQYLAWGRRP
ncbi:MAG: methyltransferase domain-containing protein [Deltaproteobacteria bacterium]|nr:methyltransferase domain-containing protein [Deltaproteobacteria bacterium]